MTLMPLVEERDNRNTYKIQREKMKQQHNNLTWFNLNIDLYLRPKRLTSTM